MSDDFIEGTLPNGTKVRYVREERLDAALARVAQVEGALRYATSALQFTMQPGDASPDDIAFVERAFLAAKAALSSPLPHDGEGE